MTLRRRLRLAWQVLRGEYVPPGVWVGSIGNVRTENCTASNWNAPTILFDFGSGGAS